jgi:hypothetical protein
MVLVWAAPKKSQNIKILISYIYGRKKREIAKKKEIALRISNQTRNIFKQLFNPELYEFSSDHNFK